MIMFIFKYKSATEIDFSGDESYLRTYFSVKTSWKCGVSALELLTGYPHPNLHLWDAPPKPEQLKRPPNSRDCPQGVGGNVMVEN